MFTYLVLSTVLAVPVPDRPDPIVDILELNHVYSERTGKRFMRVWLFWDWYPWDQRFQVIAWRWYRLDMHPERTRGYDHARRLHYLIWIDRRGKPRKVWARSYRESHTYYDRELEERRHLSAKYRPGLW